MLFAPAPLIEMPSPLLPEITLRCAAVVPPISRCGMRARSTTIGTIDTLGMILLLWIAYRSWKMPILGALPLATAGLAGSVLGWVAPLLWLVWAVVLGLMLLLAGGLHWLIGRRSVALPGQ